jgi:hypothetical protein
MSWGRIVEVDPQARFVIVNFYETGRGHGLYAEIEWAMVQQLLYLQ